VKSENYVLISDQTPCYLSIINNLQRTETMVDSLQVYFSNLLGLAGDDVRAEIIADNARTPPSRNNSCASRQESAGTKIDIAGQLQHRFDRFDESWFVDCCALDTEMIKCSTLSCSRWESAPFAQGDMRKRDSALERPCRSRADDSDASYDDQTNAEDYAAVFQPATTNAAMASALGR